jgi:hypothetical protein
MGFEAALTASEQGNSMQDRIADMGNPNQQKGGGNHGEVSTALETGLG